MSTVIPHFRLEFFWQLLKRFSLFLWQACRAFFNSLYQSLARGARAALQIYPQNAAQLEMISTAAMRCGFSGGLVVDYPHRLVGEVMQQASLGFLKIRYWIFKNQIFVFSVFDSIGMLF